MFFEVWDKEKSVNGVSAEIVLNNQPELLNTEVLLVSQTEGGPISHVESVEILKSIYGLSVDASIEDVIFRHKKELSDDVGNDEIEALRSDLNEAVMELSMLIAMGGVE